MEPLRPLPVSERVMGMRSKTFVSILLLLSLVLTACNNDDSKDETPAKSLTDVKVQLSWAHTIEFAGFYEADAKGYYKNEGLKADLLAGGFDAEGNMVDPIAVVLSGAAEFGVAASENLITARSEGKPVVAIAAIYQRNPLVYASLLDSNIMTPADMKGKSIRNDPDSAVLLAALLKSANLTLDDLNLVTLGDYSTGPLLSGEVDILPAFVTNEIVQLDGVPINIIVPSEYGINDYSNVIFTTEQMIQEKPELVEGLIRATFKGYQVAIDDPESAAKLSVARNSELDVRTETTSMIASVPLLNVPGSWLGGMDPAQWQFTMDMMIELGTLAEAIDLPQVYNLTFVEKLK